MKLASRICKYINEGKIVEFGVLKSLALTSENSLRVILNKLVKKGEIYNPIKGVYVAKDVDPFRVATALFPGYLSLTTALYLHHLIDEYPFTIFIASEKRKVAKFGEYELRYFKAKNYKGIKQQPYCMACVEKAFYDSLYHPGLVGYSKIMSALYHANISSKRFLSLCFNEKNAFFQRLGYLLSLLPEKDKEKKRLMEFCKKKVRSNIYLQGRKGGEYISEWKLIDNIGKEVLISWWK